LELFSLNYKHYVKIKGSVIISFKRRKFLGTKVPGNESSRVRKFHESQREVITLSREKKDTKLLAIISSVTSFKIDQLSNTLKHR